MPQIVIKKGAIKRLQPRTAMPAATPAGVSAAMPKLKLAPRTPARAVPPAPAAAKPATDKQTQEKTELDLALDRAIEAEKIKDYFISSVGRDMRNGIDSIVETVAWLRTGEGDERKRDQALCSLSECAKELKSMLDDLISVSHLDPNNRDSGKGPTDCAAQIAGMAESFRSDAAAKGVSLRIDVGSIPLLEVDAHRLRQLVKLLVGNSVKFTTAGRIGVEASFAGGTLKLVVEDTGCGLPPEAQQEFLELDARQDMTGEAGMELSIVKRLVFSLGGDISLRSTPGIGTVFTVRIPNLKSPSAAGAEGKFSSMQRIGAIPLNIGMRISRGAKVLVVDDSAVQLAVVNGLLKSMGFDDVDTARNGSDALVKLLTEPYDLVLTDMIMPEMDGRALVAEIRRIQGYEKMLIYGITVDDTVKDNYKELGFTDVVLKPITKDKLQAILG